MITATLENAAIIFKNVYWSNNAFKVTISQKFTNLADGKYTLSCWTQGKGTANSYKLFVNVGSNKQATDIKDDGWSRWHQTIIRGIEVKNGEAEIGFSIDGSPNTWGSIDDVEFYRQE